MKKITINLDDGKFNDECLISEEKKDIPDISEMLKFNKISRR
jgi:hypothetical protein